MKLLIYYGAVAAINAIAAIIFKDHLSIGIASAIPALIIAALISTALNERKYENLRASLYSVKFKKGESGGKFDLQKPSKFDTPCDRMVEKIFLLFAPLPLTFVLFFSGMVKLVASVAVYLLAGITVTVFCGVYTYKGVKESKARRKELEDELEEQKKREELGKWK